VGDEGRRRGRRQALGDRLQPFSLQTSRPAERHGDGRPLPRADRDRRFAAGLMGTFGVLALLIGAGGIYSVMSSIVALRW
jgi:hypothetical protein